MEDIPKKTAGRKMATFLQYAKERKSAYEE